MIGISGVYSAVFVAIMTLGYAALGWNFYRRSDRKSALLLMFYSFVYLPLTLVALYIDKL